MSTFNCQLFLSFPLIPISCLTAYVDQWIEKQFNLHIFNLQTLPAHWQQSSRAAHGGWNNLVQFQLHSASIWWCDIVAGSNRWKVNTERKRKCIQDGRVKKKYSFSRQRPSHLVITIAFVNFQCSNTLSEWKTGWCTSPKLSMRALCSPQYEASD